MLDWFCAWNCSKQTFPADFSGFAITLRKLFQINDASGGSIFLHDDLNPVDFLALLSKHLSYTDLEGKNCEEVFACFFSSFMIASRIFCLFYFCLKILDQRVEYIGQISEHILHREKIKKIRLILWQICSQSDMNFWHSFYVLYYYNL